MLKHLIFICSVIACFQAVGQEATMKLSPCALLQTALDKNPRWSEELKTFCGGKLVLADHGFTFECFEANQNVVLLSKSKLSNAPYLLIYAIEDLENSIVIQYVRTKNGKPGRMESKAILK